MVDQHVTPWVVKFCDNPQHPNVVINEFLAAGLGRGIGLSIPRHEQIWVGEGLAKSISTWLPDSKHIYKAGLHFGSRYAGGLMPGLVMDFLPAVNLSQVKNLHEAAGVAVLDLWLCNIDDRQAVYVRKTRSKRYSAFWVDFGNCFGGPTWNLDHFRGPYLSSVKSTYQFCREEYEPWLRRVEDLPSDALADLFEMIPGPWRATREEELRILKDKLAARQKRLRSLLANYLDDISHRNRDFALARPALCGEAVGAPMCVSTAQ